MDANPRTPSLSRKILQLIYAKRKLKANLIALRFNSVQYCYRLILSLEYGIIKYMSERLEIPRLTRRQLLLGSIALLSGCKIPQFQRDEKAPDVSPLLHAETEKWQEIKGPEPFFREVNFEEKINEQYVRTLINNLQQERTKSVKDRVQAVMDNLRLVGIHGGPPHGSALMIDESGYYLTARHLVAELDAPKPMPSKRPTYIYNYFAGTAESTRGLALFGETTDMAIVYAPNGRQRKAVEGIQIKPVNLENECQIWLFGTQWHEDDKIAFLGTVTGAVDAPAKHTNSYWTNLVRIRGAIPFGGLSGGPAVNCEGKIVAVESGFYADKPSYRRQDYLGSTVEPIQSLLTPIEIYHYQPYQYK